MYQSRKFPNKPNEDVKIYSLQQKVMDLIKEVLVRRVSYLLIALIFLFKTCCQILALALAMLCVVFAYVAMCVEFWFLED